MPEDPLHLVRHAGLCAGEAGTTVTSPVIGATGSTGLSGALSFCHLSQQRAPSTESRTVCQTYVGR